MKSPGAGLLQILEAAILTSLVWHALASALRRRESVIMCPCRRHSLCLVDAKSMKASYLRLHWRFWTEVAILV